MTPGRPHWRGIVAQPWLLAPVLVLGIYLVSMPRAVTFEDDGLFLMAATYAGLPQPPGYPLYVLAGHVASLIPFGTVPVRLHALSALFGAAACVFVALIGLRLTGSNAIAFVSAAAFGLSRTFWSQSIIAEVYAPNACLVFLLLWLGLLALPAHGPTDATPDKTRSRDWFAFVYGLALSLHWPLVLLSTPALAALAWPQRRELARQSPRLLLLFVAGLAPYAWMVWRSQGDVFINFYGPLRSLEEIWFFISREGYTEIDVSSTADLADKLRFTSFLGSEMLAQFTPVGLCLAVAGFAAQWRRWPRPACLALTLLFLGNTLSFLFLLYFDYDVLTRAVFRVYPHLAWGAMAVWLGLGIGLTATATARILRRDAWEPALCATLVAVMTAAVFVQNFGANDRREFTAADDYARHVLNNLPPDADLFVSGDIATHTIGYLRYVEGVRPDVTVYSLAGAVFSNRLFEPLKTPADDELRLIEQYVERSTRPICTTSTLAPQIPQRDHWLFSCMARDEPAAAYALALNDDLLAYLARVAVASEDSDAWAAYHREQLIKRAGALMGKSESMGVGLAGRYDQAFAGIRSRFFGALGYLEGLTFFPGGRQRLRDIVDVINSVTRLPADAPRPDRARFLAVRAKVHARTEQPAQAIEEFEASLLIWPDPRNESIPNLLRMYREAGETEKRRQLSLRFPSVAETPAWTPHD